VKVLQVLTFVGPGNPFGGPTRVAMNQADELRRRGHEVVVIAAQPSRATRGVWTSKDVTGFDSRAVLRRAGFSGIVSVGLYRHLWKHVRDYDVVHIHMSRDLITMPAAIIARLRKVPYVVQTHGMIDASNRRSARLLDAVATRRIISGASCVFVLTPRERDDIASLMGRRKVVVDLLPNGIATDTKSTGARAGDSAPEVLFCSRLHVRKRPRAFVQAAIDLSKEQVDARFVVVGPDEGELEAIEDLLTRAGRPEGIVIEGPLEPEAVADRLGRCSFMVLPSVDEPFPMIVLESLAAGRAVVITESCGLADFVRDNSCGVVVAPDDQPTLTNALRDLILEPGLTSEMGQLGKAAVTKHLSIRGVARNLILAYERADSANRTARNNRWYQDSRAPSSIDQD
jgi:glycosyltransferase involved in cell wall biosynthesis